MKVNIHDLKNEDIYGYNLVKASWLQKAIRRGDTATAKGIAQLYLDDNQSAGLYRKLLVFITEDIGLGCPEAIYLIQNKSVMDQVETLCKIKKNREVDRFLLSGKNLFDDLIVNKEIELELSALDKILGLADTWFSNKRLKINKTNLINAVNELSINSSEFIKKLSQDTLENYFLLSKHNSFGARTALAFIVLINTRDIENTHQNPILENIPAATLSIVDDYALDKHTSFGRILNRGIEFWLSHGCVINNEVFYPSLYLSNGKEKYPYNADE